VTLFRISFLKTCYFNHCRIASCVENTGISRTAFLAPCAAHWQYLGEEAGLSRIYGGIHYPRDERAGNQMGKRLGALAIQRDQLNRP
jgi:hypothetical protein